MTIITITIYVNMSNVVIGLKNYNCEASSIKSTTHSISLESPLIFKLSLSLWLSLLELSLLFSLLFSLLSLLNLISLPSLTHSPFSFLYSLIGMSYSLSFPFYLYSLFLCKVSYSVSNYSIFHILLSIFNS